jgi:hypothetical protein
MKKRRLESRFEKLLYKSWGLAKVEIRLASLRTACVKSPFLEAGTGLRREAN